MVRKGDRPKAESLVPSIKDQDLTAVAALPRKVNLKQSAWNFLINTGEVIHREKPLPPFPQRKLPLPETIFVFF